jgi:TonB-linked SusC/RagA family outer membrane protein
MMKWKTLFCLAAFNVLTCALPYAQAQTALKKINGTVMDSKGEPLIAASVQVKNTANGTVTDTNGSYFIETGDKNAVLVFSFLGYKTQEIAVGNQINVNVTMVEDENTLEEVVVSAYGTQKKVSVVGAIENIAPTKLQTGISRSISNNLAGQLAGIIGVQRSGEPGRDNSDIWIRGLNTFQGFTSPLILVDGIERSMNDMDPAEIESFSILKDASATAMYGVRGANGVIIINTKRGELGKPKVSLRTEYGGAMPTQLPEYVDAVKYMETLNSIRRENGETVDYYSQDRINMTKYGYDPELYANTDWIDVLTRDYSTSSRTNLTISGGSPLLRYSVVASYLNEQGIIVRDPNQEWDSSIKLDRYNIRSNVDVNISSTTLIRASVGGYLQNENRPPSGDASGLISSAFRTPPILPVVYKDGKIPLDRENPWMSATQIGYARNSSSKIESTFAAEQDLKMLLQGLRAKLTFSFDSYTSGSVVRSKEVYRYKPATARNDEGELIFSSPSDGQEFLGHSVSGSFGNKTTYMEANVSYTNTLAERNYLDFMLLANRRQYDDGSAIPYRNQGMAGRFSYNYDYRYIVEVNFGFNGSENLSPKHRYGFFPSIAVGYVLSEEEFMRDYKNIFSNVKFRLSYGLVGNDQMAGRRFSYLTTIENTKDWRGSDAYYYWGADGSNVYRLGRQEGEAGITNLKWETVEKINFGLDLRLFNSLNLRADIFREHRTDILMARNSATPEESGIIHAVWANYGIVNNKGLDLTLEYNKRIDRNWDVSFRGTLTWAKNVIIEKDEPKAVIGTWKSQTGHSINTIQGYEAVRLCTEEDFNPDGTLRTMDEYDADGNLVWKGLPVHSFTAGGLRPGDILYADKDGDGYITGDDSGPLDNKTTDPQIVYGAGVTVGYRAFDISVFFQGTSAMYRMIGNGYQHFLPGAGMGSIGNIMTNIDSRWTPEDPRQDVFYPRLDWGINDNNIKPSTWWLRDMSFIRLKNMELGYTVPKSALTKISIENARIFLSGTNLLTFSKFKLWDPEIGSDHGTTYPTMKSVQMGININF